MSSTNSKRFLAVILALSLMAFAGIALAQDTGTTTPSQDDNMTMPSPGATTTTPGMTPGQASITGLNEVDSDSFQASLLTSCLNVPQATITRWRDRGYSFGQIGVAANIANRANVPVEEVLNRFDQGQSLTTVAAAYNVPVSDTTVFTARAGMMGVAPEVAMYSDQFLTRYWGISQADLNRWHAAGFTNDQIAMAANLSARSGRSTQDILNMVSAGQSWNQIASDLNVPVAQLSVPVARPIGVAESNLMRSILARDFNLTSTQIDNLIARGYSFEEIAVIGNLAARSGRSPSAIADMAANGMSWNEIASNVGVSTALVSVPVTTFVARRPIAGGAAAGSRVLPRTGK